MAISKDTIDFTIMYATHEAFRRDLERFAAASAAGKTGAAEVRAGWENFKKQLLIHHSVEDAWLWPRVRREVAGRSADLVLLDEMEAETSFWPGCRSPSADQLAVVGTALPEATSVELLIIGTP